MANIDEIKQANRIEDVIRVAGHDLTGHGRYLRSRQHDSLVVDTQGQAFFWNAEGKQGDVITWVQDWKRTDFKGAVEFLARMAGLPEPSWGQGDSEQRIAGRVREDALTVASRRYANRLGRDGTALAYVRGRGWTDETIKAAQLGFTGGHSAEELAELRTDLTNSGISPLTPGAVAILGYEGGVGAWAKEQKIPEFPPEWGKAKRLPAIWADMLVYPHVVGGRVTYLSLRGIKEKKHFNLSSVLVGPRRPYFNHVYGPGEETVVVVEGQADAVTLAQWGIAGVALAGVSANEGLLRQLGKHKHVYVALDKDKAGESHAWPLAQALGPMCRLVEWPAHDANDWLQLMAAEGASVEDQTARVGVVINRAKPLVLVMAEAAGRAQGAGKDEGTKGTLEMVAQMDGQDQALYRGSLAKALGLPVRDYSNLLSQVMKELGVEAKDEDEGIQETVGGFIGGWLIELLYKPEQKTTAFAFRSPEGKIGEANELEIEGVTYKPKGVDDLIKQQVVVLPSAIGAEISERELLDKIVSLIQRYYLIDEFYMRLVAYYVLFTYAYDSFTNVVYLRMKGPAGAGKSSLMAIIGYICRRLIRMTGADSEAALYRTLALYRGTLFIDEADKTESDTDSPFVKILNVGYRADGFVTKMRDAGSGRYVPETFAVYGPKLLTTRKEFEDDGLESRCLSIDVVQYSTAELKSRGIPLQLESDYYREAAVLRNELLSWRLRTWKPEVKIDPDLVDVGISPRLNQVITPIMQIIQDEGIREEMRLLVRRYQERRTTEKSMTLEAKVLQAIVEIHEGDLSTVDVEGKACLPYVDLSVGNIAMVTNRIVDEENAEAEGGSANDAPELVAANGQPLAPTDTEKTAGGMLRIKSRKIGSILKALNLVTEHMTSGPMKRRYVLQWDEVRINGLRGEYGI